MEQQHPEPVGQPMLLLALIDAAERVEYSLDWTQEPDPALEYGSHVAAERARQRQQDRRIDSNLNPAVRGHRGLGVKTSLVAAGRRPGRPTWPWRSPRRGSTRMTSRSHRRSQPNR